MACSDLCQVVGRESLAVKFDRVEIAFIFALFCWLTPVTNEIMCNSDSEVRADWLRQILISSDSVSQPVRFDVLSMSACLSANQI